MATSDDTINKTCNDCRATVSIPAHRADDWNGLCPRCIALRIEAHNLAMSAQRIAERDGNHQYFDGTRELLRLADDGGPADTDWPPRGADAWTNDDFSNQNAALKDDASAAPAESRDGSRDADEIQSEGATRFAPKDVASTPQAGAASTAALALDLSGRVGASLASAPAHRGAFIVAGGDMTARTRRAHAIVGGNVAAVPFAHLARVRDRLFGNGRERLAS